MTLFNLIFKNSILFLVVSSLLPAQSFFIHLTPAAEGQRADLLDNTYNSLSLKKISSDTSVHIAEIEPHLIQKSGLKNWLLLTGASAKDVVKLLSDNGTIDIADSVGRFKIEAFGNDTLINKQWFLDKIGVDAAWTHGQGDPSIVVGVLDTGVDYNHTDLWPGLWINSAEDINHNGRLDSDDNNGIDDDGNGYVDDVIGWDFTDAPRFADGGDYKTPDNDPMDEFSSGHGTQVTGLIVAQNNNVTGGSGIAPGCRVMVLRAGTASGYLEEDDVARAILYALDNGARIVNMSFGDVVLSRFLKDVIRYASEKDLVMVASAGNSAKEELLYPAGLPETISVGASTLNDGLASFSSYNNALDLVAPGQDILSTAVGNQYNSVDGTSFSAPIVSAAAALLLSNNPQTGPDEIRNLLKTSVDDILLTGWDIFSGAGRLNIGRALDIPFGGSLSFSQPQSEGSFSDDSLDVVITAAHPQLKETSLFIGIGREPERFTPVGGAIKRQFINEHLTTLSLKDFPDTVLTLRMVMDLQGGMIDESRVSFYKDQSPPVISNVTITPLIDGADNSILVTFHTDDICTAHLSIRPSESVGKFIKVGDAYETQNHRIKLDHNNFDGSYSFFIEARNLGGLSARADKAGTFYHFSLQNNPQSIRFQKVPWSLPAGYMLNKVLDLDHDGRKEIAISRYDEKNAFGPIEIYEFENGIFQLRLKTGFKAIPRDAGDVDSDGNSDMLLGFGQYSFLLEASAPDSFPTKLIWQDTTGFWAAGYTDGDDDGNQEIAGYKDNVYHLLESLRSNHFIEMSELDNPTTGANRLGIPKIQIVDFDGDGKKELVYGDYDGDLIAYGGVGDNQMALKATGKTWHQNAAEMLTTDKTHLITATHTSENKNFEHEFDARFWSIETFSLEQNKLTAIDTINTFGYASTRDFDSGLMFARLDTMHLLFATFFPNLFVFNHAGSDWRLAYTAADARSNTILVADMDNDGFDEFYYNNGNKIVGYSAQAANRPKTPQIFEVEMLDSVSAMLSWQGNAPSYHIYRGERPDQLLEVAQTNRAMYTDRLTSIEKKYYYRVLAVDSSFTMPASYFSHLDSATTAIPPHFVDLTFSNSHQCLIRFDRKLSFKNDKKAQAVRSRDGETESSILIGGNASNLLVTFSVPFIPAVDDTLLLLNVFGQSGVPLSARQKKVHIHYITPSRAPYVKYWEWLGTRELRIDFTQDMALSELATAENYSIEPGGNIAKISVPDGSQKSVQITFADNVPIGASGIPAYLHISGMHNSLGVVMEKPALISLNRDVADLSNLLIYPQPLRPEDDKLVFSNLVGQVTINIYNLNGQKVKTLKGTPKYGGISWDLTTTQNEKIETGVYLYDVRTDTSSKQGKIVIIR